MTEKLRKQLERLELAVANRKSKGRASGMETLTVSELRFAVYFAERCEKGDRNFAAEEWAEAKRIHAR